MKQVHIFGDSVLKGVIYEAESGRYRLCKDRIQADGLDIRNHSRLGATSAQGLEIIQKSLAECGAGTFSLIEYGGNDCNYDWKVISDDPLSSPDCTVTPEHFTENLKRAADLLQSAGSEVAFSTLVPISDDKFMNFISRDLSYANILRWLGKIRRLYDWQEYYSSLVRDTAAHLGCRVLDLRTAFPSASPDSLLCADGIHPTETGHQLIHRFLEKEL